MDRELQSKTKVSTAQVGVLTVILKGKNVTQKDVANTLGLNESAITAMVKKLVSMKYIERHRNNTDARAYTLKLTQLGKNVQMNSRPPFKKINSQIEYILNNDEIANLADYLQRSTNEFEN